MRFLRGVLDTVAAWAGAVATATESARVEIHATRPPG
jgi:hypothetical protein